MWKGPASATVRCAREAFLSSSDVYLVDFDRAGEIDEVYVAAGKKGRERNGRSRSRGLSTRGRGTYEEDKPPMIILVDRGTDRRYVVPAETVDESTIRLLLAASQQESLTVYTDGFRAYEPLEEDDSFEREYVVHGDGEYADGAVHVNTGESTGRCCDRGSHRIEASQNIN